VIYAPQQCRRFNWKSRLGWLPLPAAVKEKKIIERGAFFGWMTKLKEKWAQSRPFQPLIAVKL